MNGLPDLICESELPCFFCKRSIESHNYNTTKKVTRCASCLISCFGSITCMNAYRQQAMLENDDPRCGADCDILKETRVKTIQKSKEELRAALTRVAMTVLALRKEKKTDAALRLYEESIWRRANPLRQGQFISGDSKPFIESLFIAMYLATKFQDIKCEAGWNRLKFAHTDLLINYQCDPMLTAIEMAKGLEKGVIGKVDGKSGKEWKVLFLNNLNSITSLPEKECFTILGLAGAGPH